jgi:hypothetical protein
MKKCITIDLYNDRFKINFGYYPLKQKLKIIYAVLFEKTMEFRGKTYINDIFNKGVKSK